MEGTVRHFNNEISKKVENSIRLIAESTAQAYGGTAELEYHSTVPPTVNDEACTVVVEEAVTDVLGRDALFECEKKGTVWSNHSNHFTSDEEVLTGGAAVYAQIAASYLEKHS